MRYESRTQGFEFISENENNEFQELVEELDSQEDDFFYE